MSEIVYYEKPGCINGEKQKAILRAGGHHLICIDLLQHPWTEEELLRFVAGKTPVEIMNSNAPAIKKGEVVPDSLSFGEAIKMMLREPILIKRPLIIVDEMAIQGFTAPRLSAYLSKWDGNDDVVTCPNLDTLSCDEKKSSQEPL